MLAAPMARLQQKKQAAVTTGSTGTTGIPRAMVLTLIRDLLGAPGFLATVVRVMRKHHRERSISVGMPGPHDFTSAGPHSSAASQTSTASPPHVS
jgi:hypothetical protein